MNAPTTFPFPFEIEARELSDDEHHGLVREREEIEMDNFRAPKALYWFDREHGFHADPADYYAAHRDRFLEQAREMFGERVA